MSHLSLLIIIYDDMSMPPHNRPRPSASMSAVSNERYCKCVWTTSMPTAAAVPATIKAATVKNFFVMLSSALRSVRNPRTGNGRNIKKWPTLSEGSPNHVSGIAGMSSGFAKHRYATAAIYRQKTIADMRRLTINKQKYSLYRQVQNKIAVS